MMTPNRRLRQARELRGWSQAKVAEQIGTDATTVSRWERGLFSPTPYFRERLCALFGKNAEELGLLETASQVRQHSVSVSEPFSTLVAQQEQAAVRVTEPLYAEGALPMDPPSWPERTDTFSYILQSLAHDEQAHILWENAYVRVLQGEFTQAQQLGEASLNAFQQVGHMNATVIREWLNQRGLASAQPPAAHTPHTPHTPPTPRPTPEKSRRVPRRFGFGKGLGFLLLLIAVTALIFTRVSFGQSHQTAVTPPHAAVEHDIRPQMAPSSPISPARPGSTSPAHPAPTSVPSPVPTAPSTSLWSGVTMSVIPTQIMPQNCVVDSNGYRCTLTMQLSANGTGPFSWTVESQNLIVKLNEKSGTIAPGEEHQMIVYIHNPPGQTGQLIFSCTAFGHTYSSIVTWLG